MIMGSGLTGVERERQAKYLARYFLNMIKVWHFEKYSVLASTDSQVALISLGADCVVGVVDKTCIGAPTRLIYSLKSWIDKSFIKRFK
jgi:NADH dehydrogenase